MDEIKREMMTELLKSIAAMIGHLDLDTLKEYVEQMDEESSRYDALAPLIDPTFYMQHGRPEWFGYQDEIIKGILRARQGIEDMKDNVDPDTMREQAKYIKNIHFPGHDN